MELHHSETADNRTNYTILACVNLLAVFLNQSNVLLGVNLSLSDFFILSILLLLLFNKKLKIESAYLTIGLFFSIILLVNSVFIIPIQFDLIMDPRAILRDYLKILVLFFYFIAGTHLTKFHYSRQLLKGFVTGAVIIGAAGIGLSFITVPIVSEWMFYGGTRLIGLMNDPNYFAVIQCAALAGVFRLKFDYPWLKFLAAPVLILSIISSGSKSGSITLVVYFFYIFVKTFFSGQLNGKKIFCFLIFLVLLLMSLPQFTFWFNELLSAITDRFPIFERIQLLLENPDSAISGGGSNREAVWMTAIQIIQNSPILGIGVGNYATLAFRISGDPNVAHNTYLQLSAEWGLIITFLFIVFVLKALFSKRANQETETVQPAVREMLFIFLTASMSISLNNARLFWLLLGMTVYKGNDPDER